jgi:crotonobetainyl-CoA:carnitine CoA-transferase CaiB-like acyl-CoA transferase
VLSVGNDPTFERFCKLAECEHLLEDERFQTNAARVSNRDHVTSVLNEITNKKPSAWWLEELEREKIGCGPINNLDQVFDDPHVKAREMVVEMEHPAMGTKPMKLIANPIKLSKTPPTYRKAPPMLGQHTEDILKEAGLSENEIAKLKDDGTV